MKKIILYTILSFSAILFCGCEQTSNPKIEIYLLNKRIEPNYGVLITQLPDFTGVLSEMDSITFSRFKNMKIDTISKRGITAGEFDATKKDLKNKPLITDSDIISFNFEKNEIIIKTEAAKKIKELKSNVISHIQFVIALDKKPILTGYFASPFSSYPSNWNYISTIPLNSSNDPTLQKFTIEKTNYINNIKIKHELPDLKKNSPFYNAFKNSNRIIQ